MKINRHHIFILFIPLLAFSACFMRENPDNFLIKGKINGAEGQNIYLEELTINQLSRIDSTVLGSDGSFEFSELPPESGFYLLKLENGKFITLNLGKADKNEIHADFAKFPDEYTVTGTFGSALLHDYFTKTAVNQRKLDSLSQIFMASQGADNFYEIKQRIDSSFYQLFSHQQLFLRNLLSGNPGSIASLLLLNQRFANKILLDENENFDLFVKIDSSIFAKYPTNTHVAKHHERVLKIIAEKAEQAKSEALLAPGNPAPVLSLRDVSDQTVSLASFTGKMVLLNFWASWSPPSRAANIQLKEIYQKYYPMGFEIFGVSLDTNPEIWKKSIEIDRLQWPNVSDLAGINSPVRKLYNLPENLPYFYLLDKDGKILAKGFTIAQLRAILKEKLD